MKNIKNMAELNQRVELFTRKNVLKIVQQLRYRKTLIAIRKIQNVIRRRCLPYVVHDNGDDDTSINSYTSSIYSSKVKDEVSSQNSAVSSIKTSN